MLFPSACPPRHSRGRFFSTHPVFLSKINSDAPAGQQLDELEGWLDRQKDHDAGDWPTGEFTGGKHDRHDSADDPKA